MIRSGRTPYPVILLLSALLMFFVFGTIDYRQWPYSEYDHLAYRLMADAAPGLRADQPRPYAFRLLGPYLAGLLPLSVPRAFTVLSLAGLAALPLLFYRFLLLYGTRPAVACLTALVLVLHRYFFGIFAWNYFRVNEVISLLVIIVMLSALQRRQWWGFTLALLAGILARETALVMLPVSLVYLLERRRWRAERARWLAAAGLGMLLFGALRLTVPFAGGEGLAAAFLTHSRKLAAAMSWGRLLVNSFLPFALVPFLFVRASLGWLRCNRWAVTLLLTVFLSALFGGNNERLMAPAFPAFYLLLAFLVQDHLRPRLWFRLLLLAAAALASCHHVLGRWPLPSREVTIALTALATLLVTTAAALNAARGT